MLKRSLTVAPPAAAITWTNITMATGVVSSISCYHASGTLLVWAISGDFPTYVCEMEEVGFTALRLLKFISAASDRYRCLK